MTLAHVLGAEARRSAKPLKAIAAEIGVGYDYLKSATNPDRDDTHFQSRWLVPFMRATGSLEPLRWLAAQMGCAIVELPTVLGSDDDLFRALAVVVQEVGEDAAELQRACEDGCITPDELIRFDREIEDSIEALLRLKALMAARVEQPATALVRPPMLRREAVHA